MQKRASRHELCSEENAIESLRKKFGQVEILPPDETLEGFGWFVQIRKSAKDEFPMGAFGKTARLAAVRLVAITQLWDRENRHDGSPQPRAGV